MSNTTNNLKPVEANLIISNKNLPDGSVRTTAFYSTVVTKNVSIILDDDTAVVSALARDKLPKSCAFPVDAIVT